VQNDEQQNVEDHELDHATGEGRLFFVALWHVVDYSGREVTRAWRGIAAPAC
jgi:hypothetical protein